MSRPIRSLRPLLPAAPTLALLIACCGAAAGAGDPAPEQSERGTATQPEQTVSIDQLREEAIGILVQAAVDAPPEVRANAIEGLLLTPRRLEPLLPAALASDNLGVRSVAAVAVGKARLRSVSPAVTPLLGDSDARARASAAYALARCGDTGHMAALADALRNRDPRVRAHAAYLLGELSNPSAVPMLKEAARDEMPTASSTDVQLMRLQIAEARVKLGDLAALNEVRAALHPARPEDLEAAALAAQIAGQTGDRSVMRELVELVDRPNEAGQLMPAEIRLAAAASLAKLGSPDGSYVAKEFATSERPALRAQSALVLGETARRGDAEVLAQLLHDPVEQVRIAAAAAVVRLAERRR